MMSVVDFPSSPRQPGLGLGFYITRRPSQLLLDVVLLNKLLSFEDVVFKDTQTTPILHVRFVVGSFLRSFSTLRPDTM